MLDDPKRFDPADLWGVVTREKPTSVTIVGDSFAKPMVRELADAGARYDLSSLLLIASSGVMWSEETKQALLAANPKLMLIDSFSSSEAVGMGMSVTTAKGAVQTARFPARRQHAPLRRDAASRSRRRPASRASSASAVRSPSATTRTKPRARAPS